MFLILEICALFRAPLVTSSEPVWLTPPLVLPEGKMADGLNGLNKPVSGGVDLSQCHYRSSVLRELESMDFEWGKSH